MLLQGPAADDVGAEERALAALSSLDYDEVAFLPGRAIEDLLAVVSVERPADCGGEIKPDSWRLRLELAVDQVQLLEIDEGLSMLAMLEVELACWPVPVTPSDAQGLFRALADTHELAADMKPDARGFHLEESYRALAALEAMGGDTGLDPSGVAHVVGGGPLGDVLLDGMPVGRVVERVHAGTHLVQVVSGRQVLAASWLTLEADQRAVLWAGEAYEGDLAVEVDFVARHVGQPELLPYAALVLEEPLLIAAMDSGPVRLYSPSGLELETSARDMERREATAPGLPQPGPSRDLVLGASLGAAWHRGRVPGVSGGLAIGARYNLSPRWQASGVIQPQLQRSQLPEAYDLDHVWRLSVPLRAGVHRTNGHYEIGPELAVVYGGPGLGADLAGVLAVRVTEGVGPLLFTLDAWGGGGASSLQAGVTVGFARGL